jgi:hypothetical protein
MRDDEFDIPAELLQAAASAAAPALTPPALRKRFGSPASWQIVRGQLWRARSGDVTLLLLIMSVAAEAVTAVPVTVDPAAENEESLIVGSRRTALDQPVTVWGGMQRRIRTEVLDWPIDDIGEDVAAWVTNRSTIPPGCRAGASPASPFEPDAEVGAMVADDVDNLAAARSWAAGLDYAPEPARPVPAIQPTKAQLLELQRRLEASLPDVLALVDGDRPPSTAGETVALREVLGREPHVRAPAHGLVVELSHPRWRSAARAFGRRSNRTEPEARLAMAYEISGASMAARQTGGQDPVWRDRVERWLQAQGLENADL